jgi:hypothetical protein
VLLEFNEQPGHPAAPKRITPSAKQSESDVLDDPTSLRYRASAIQTYAPPHKSRGRAVERISDVAKNALHVVPVSPESVTPVYRKGAFQPEAGGRLRRVDDGSQIRSSRKLGVADDDTTDVVNTEADSFPRRSPDVITIKVESVQDLPGRKRSVPGSLASLQREAPLPLEPVPAPAGKAATPAPDESVTDESFKSIQQVAVNIEPSQGELPQNLAATRFARESTIPHAMGYSRYDVSTEVSWAAPSFCHRPLLFEEVNLERHGHRIPLIQPVLSAAHFFGRVPAVPYLAVSEKYRVCQYTLGHYRPGSPAPYVWYYPSFSLDGAALEAGLITGLIYALP